MTADEVRADAVDTYSHVAARPLQPRVEYGQPDRLGETRLLIASPDAKVPLFSRKYRVTSYAEARPGQAEALEVLAGLMGGDTGTLYKKLVVQLKIATDAGASYDGDARDDGEFTVMPCRAPACRSREWSRRSIR